MQLKRLCCGGIIKASSFTKSAHFQHLFLLLWLFTVWWDLFLTLFLKEKNQFNAFVITSTLGLLNPWPVHKSKSQLFILGFVPLIQILNKGASFLSIIKVQFALFFSIVFCKFIYNNKMFVFNKGTPCF